MINRILGELESASNGQHRSSEANDDARQVAAAISKQSKQVQIYAEQLITSHPVAALSVAVVAGLAIGWWVKRK